MKTRFFLIALATLIGGTFSANAQLTTGEPTAKVIRTGNRAKAGDFGLYVGATSSMFGNIFDDSIDMTALPLINFKYMTSNKFEIRVGLETYKYTERLSGNQTENATDTPVKNKYGESSFMVSPGFAYHFSKSNILDVYIGAELPLGWDSNTYKYSKETTANPYTESTTKRAFNLGLGAFIGLQAYIADLPIAVGVEYGLASRLDAGIKYKNVTTMDGTETTTYSTKYSDFRHLTANGYDYSKLSARKGEIGSQLRFTLSYYFK